MISVIGSESDSAFLKSSSNAFESALFALADAELADVDARGWPPHARGGVEDRPDGLLGRGLVAAQLEVHEHRAAVLGDLALVALGVRRLDLVDGLRAAEIAAIVSSTAARTAGS